MTTQTVRLWGNSLGVRLPQSIVQQVGIKDGTTVSIHVEGNTIVLSPARPKYTLSELLRTADPAQQADEVDWGEPVGAEFW